MGTALQGRSKAQFVADLPFAERVLSDHDAALGRVIASQPARWPSQPTEIQSGGSFEW